MAPAEPPKSGRLSPIETIRRNHGPADAELLERLQTLAVKLTLWADQISDRLDWEELLHEDRERDIRGWLCSAANTAQGLLALRRGRQAVAKAG